MEASVPVLPHAGPPGGVGNLGGAGRVGNGGAGALGLAVGGGRFMGRVYRPPWRVVLESTPKQCSTLEAKWPRTTTNFWATHHVYI